MLRINQITGPDAMSVLKLEGKLVGPWVPELARCWELLTRPADQVHLDLSAVTFVDGPGVALLRDLLGQGAKLTGCSALVIELLQGEKR